MCRRSRNVFDAQHREFRRRVNKALETGRRNLLNLFFAVAKSDNAPSRRRLPEKREKGAELTEAEADAPHHRVDGREPIAIN
jgi:hypothetical protein